MVLLIPFELLEKLLVHFILDCFPCIFFWREPLQNFVWAERNNPASRESGPG